MSERLKCSPALVFLKSVKALEKKFLLIFVSRREPENEYFGYATILEAKVIAYLSGRRYKNFDTDTETK